MLSIQSVPFFAPTTSLKLEVPSAQIDGIEAYPIQSPDGIPLKVSRELWQRFVQQGEIHNIAQLRQELFKNGITNKTLGRTGKEAPISDIDMRAVIADWTYQTMIPLHDEIEDGDDKGFGLCRNREEADERTASLRRRAEKMKKAGDGTAAAGSSWGKWERTCPGWDDEAVATVLDAIQDGRKTNGQLSALIGGGDRSKAKAWKGTRIRALIHDLRAENGWPIIAGNRGYTMAESPSELKAYLTGSLKGRIKFTLERADQNEKAAGFWFPESAAELAEADKLKSKPRQIPPSAYATARRKAAADALDTLNQDRQADLQIYRDAAEARVKELKPRYDDAIFREGYFPDSLTEKDKAVLAEVGAARKFAKGGNAPRGKTYRWSPPKTGTRKASV